jgi:hypothetical protein
MELTEKYKDLAERKAKIDLREGQGLRMLFDNFDADWKRGDEPHGTMTFTDVMPPEIPPEPTRDLAAEIDQIKVDIAAIKTKVGIK